MVRGPVTLLRPNPLLMKAWAGAMLLMVPVGISVGFVPQPLGIGLLFTHDDGPGGTPA